MQGNKNHTYENLYFFYNKSHTRYVYIICFETQLDLPWQQIQGIVTTTYESGTRHQ